MPSYWNPGVQPRQDQFIAQTGQQISGAVVDAINQYKKDQEQQAFSDTLMHHLAQTPSDPTDPNSAPIVPIDQLNDYTQAPLKKKIGMAMAAQSEAATSTANAYRKATLDLQRNAQSLAERKFAEDTQPFTISDEDRANLRNAGYEAAEVMPGKYQLVPYGGANGADNFEPDAAKVEEMRQIGKVWAPMGPHQGQWVDDPNSWVNSQQLTPIKDPRDETGQKIVGFQQPNGSIRYFPSTNMADAVAALAKGAQPTQQTPAAAKPTPATTAAPAMTADTAPEGSYARKGTQWYRKTSGQWQPTSGPAAQ